MSRKRLIDQYINGVVNHSPTHNHKSLSDVYSSLYREDTQQQLPGIDGGEDEEYVAVFYINKNSLTEDIVKQFRAIGGDGPIHVPASYFTKVEKRFRGKTIENLAHQWLKSSTKGGKVDNLAYESLLNKLFDTDIKGAEDLSELKDVVSWSSGEESNFIGGDIIHQTLASNDSVDINFNELLQEMVSHFIAEDVSSFLFKLWNITEQAKGVGVGKGEIAISLLSRGYKGEPGDVKFDQNESGPQLDVEVKGSGGRPGKSGHTRKFKNWAVSFLKNENFNVVLDDASVQDIQQNIHNSNLSTKLMAVRQWFENTLVSKHLKGQSVGVNSKGDVIQNFLRSLESLPNETSGDDVNSIISKIRRLYLPVQSVIDEYNETTGKSIRLPAKMTDILFGKGTGGIALYIKTYHDYRSISLLKNMNWREAVTFFFTFVVKQQLENGYMNESHVAEALAELRSDPVSRNNKTVNLSGSLVSALNELLSTEGVDIVYDKDTLGKLIAAIQFTGYCSADEFNRALFINDKTLNARSIPTSPIDISSTLNTLYREFIENDYTISMNVDDRSKGVQITYNG